MISVAFISGKLMKSYSDQLALPRVQLDFKITVTIRRAPVEWTRSIENRMNNRRVRLPPCNQKTLSLLAAVLESQLRSVHLDFNFLRRQFPLTVTTSHKFPQAPPGRC